MQNLISTEGIIPVVVFKFVPLLVFLVVFVSVFLVFVLVFMLVSVYDGRGKKAFGFGSNESGKTTQTPSYIVSLFMSVAPQSLLVFILVFNKLL